MASAHSILHRFGLAKVVWFSAFYFFCTTILVWSVIYSTANKDYRSSSSATGNTIGLNNNDDDEDKGFATVFPIYYRAVGLFILGLWCWAINIAVLAKTPIHSHSLLFPSTLFGDASLPSSPVSPLNGPSTSSNNPSPTYSSGSSLTSLVHLSAILTWIYCTNVILFVMLRSSSSALPSTILPASLYIILAFVMFCPWNVLEKAYRDRLIAGLKRSLLSPFERVLFVDVIVLDIFCSFAKVFGDMEIAICTIVRSPDLHYSPFVYQSCVHSIFPILITCFPFLWRLLQCLRQYQAVNTSIITSSNVHTNNNNAALDSPLMTSIALGHITPSSDVISQRRIHLANAAKYGTSLVVILLNALKKQIFFTLEQQSTIDLIANLWLTALVLNSLYSLYWDIYFDFDLGKIRKPLLSPSLQYKSHHVTPPIFLRERLVFGPPLLYYTALLLNALLRFIWVAKLPNAPFSFGLVQTMDKELKLFTFEMLEVARRCLWVFFRMENQYLQAVDHK